jgi:predicted nucleotidyltransferase
MGDSSMIERTAHVLATAASSPARVILYGSSVRGGIDQDSDLDFLVIEREVFDRIAEAVRVRKALGDMGCRSTSSPTRLWRPAGPGSRERWCTTLCAKGALSPNPDH